MATPSYHPIKGGTETIVQNLSGMLKRIGVNVDIMTFNMDRKWHPRWKAEIDEIDGISVTKVPALNWMPINNSTRINLGVTLIPGRFTNLLKKYDIIHFHGPDLSFPLFSLMVKKPKLFQLHGLDVSYFKRYHLSRFILKNIADLYVSITRQMKNELIEIGVPEEKITYLPNSIDTRLFDSQMEKEDNLLLFVGRIVFEKGLHVLLESLRHLEIPIRLIIIGPMGSGDYRQKIEKCMEKERKRGKHEIKYLGSLNQDAGLVKWYRKASIFIAPSISEAFGIVILEALACRTPVIATSVGGIPEVIQNHKNGILVPPNDPLELAEAIKSMLENKRIRIDMGREGRKRVVNNFSLEATVEKLHGVYESLLGQEENRAFSGSTVARGFNLGKPERRMVV